VPLHNEAGSKRELAERVKSILATKRLTLHQASQTSATLFGRGSPYYLPHNLYYDLSHGHFSPSLFQLVAFSRISNYRLRDWLRVLDLISKRFHDYRFNFVRSEPRFWNRPWMIPTPVFVGFGVFPGAFFLLT